MNNTIINFRKALNIHGDSSIDELEFQNIIIFLGEYLKIERKSKAEKTRKFLMEYMGSEYANKVYKDYLNSYNKIVEEYISDDESDIDKHKKSLLNKIEAEMIFRLLNDNELEELKNYTTSVLSGNSAGIFKNKTKRGLTRRISTIAELIKAGY